MTHFHIRWSNRNLDWQPFGTPAEAEEVAKEILRPDETYTIEELDEKCERCQAALNDALKKRHAVR